MVDKGRGSNSLCEKKKRKLAKQLVVASLLPFSDCEKFYRDQTGVSNRGLDPLATTIGKIVRFPPVFTVFTILKEILFTSLIDSLRPWS